MDAYKKRSGTSGISGQLYETKLISLILFRLLHDDDIEEFYLASNMDDIGAFDDICIKVKIAGHDRPIVVLVQAKHKEKEDNILRYELIQELSTSFVKIRQRFSGKDSFFTGKFEDTDCVFILYTNAKYYNDLSYVESEGTVPSSSSPLKQGWKPYRSSFSENLKKLIATGDTQSQGYQADNNDKDLELANDKILEEEVTTLAERLTKFLDDKTNQSMNIMHDEYIIRYHVILAKTVVDISDVQHDDNKSEPWRGLTFKNDFFNTDDKPLRILRKNIYEQIFKALVNTKHNKPKEKSPLKDDAVESMASAVDLLISQFLSEPSALSLSHLIGTYIINKKGNLEFSIGRPNSDLEKLEQINITPVIVEEAEAIAARNILSSLKLKVPATFGNVDLKIPGNQKKIDKRVKILSETINNLCKQSKLVGPHAIVTIDQSLGDGFLSLNGGIGSAIGNLLVYDNDTKYLKFTEDPSSLPNIAKSLFDDLKFKISNMCLYRFDVRAIPLFPKLVFDYTDEAKAIFELAIIYDKQSNHNGVETMLKKEIEQYNINNGSDNLSIKSESMFIHYHNEVQKWWMSLKSAKYLVKSNKNNIYKQAINNVITEPEISAMQITFNVNHMKCFGYIFNKNAIDTIASFGHHPKTIIVTDNFILTIAKIIQLLKNKYAVLDLEYINNLSIIKFTALVTEIKSTDKKLIVILKVTNRNPTIIYKRLYDLTQAMEKKNIIVVTNKEFLEVAQEYFLTAQVIFDEKHSLSDLSLESQRDITKSTQVIFQGEVVNLDLLLDTSAACVDMIKGLVLDKIIRNETIRIDKCLSNSSYRKIKHLYVDRKIRLDSKVATNNCDYTIKTFDDIDDNVVVVLAEAGMGKSTLLTHLSLKTKEIDKQVWIVRINLLDYTKEFKKWQDDKTVIDNLEVVKFMCQVVLDNNEHIIYLKETNNKVYLDTLKRNKDDDSNEWTTFLIKLFLHFFNEKKLIFLFDGYDEICPHYKNIVNNLIDIVKIYSRHKMWVTSRPYSEIVPDLKEITKNTYILDYLNDTDQALWLENIWRDKLTPEKLNTDQLNNIESLLDFNQLSEYMDLSLYFTFKRLFDHFYRYVHFNLIYDPEMADIYSRKSEKADTDKEDTDTGNTQSNTSEKPSDSRAQEIMGTPLLLYLMANHIIINLIYNKKKFIRKAHLFTIYEMFIETQVDEIRFQDKNKMDTSRPDVTRIFEKERADFINMHKKLGAYAILGDLFTFYDEFKTMRPFIKDPLELNTVLNIIKSGTEKTGLISYVTVDNIPVFIHKTIAEYFATEYLSDIFKSNIEFDCKKLLYITLVEKYELFYLWVKNKAEVDKEIDDLFEEIKSDSIGYAYCQVLSSFIADNCSERDRIRMNSASFDDYEDDYLDVVTEKVNMLLESDLDDKNTAGRKIVDSYIIEKMKPHLKKYFVDTRKSE